MYVKKSKLSKEKWSPNKGSLPLRENRKVFYEKEEFIMNDFNRGILFAVGLAMFGKGMYGLGRAKERRVFTKALKKATDELTKQMEEIEEEIRLKKIKEEMES